MSSQAIINELLSIEADARVYQKGLQKLCERSYLLRKKLEEVLSSSASPERVEMQQIRAKASGKFRRNIEKKLVRSNK